MGGTWDLDPDGFSLRVFFLHVDIYIYVYIYYGGCVLVISPPPPLEWVSFPPLVVTVLTTPKGAESPDSGCIGVIGVLVFFSHLRPSR